MQLNTLIHCILLEYEDLYISIFYSSAAKGKFECQENDPESEMQLKKPLYTNNIQYEDLCTITFSCCDREEKLNI